MDDLILCLKKEKHRRGKYVAHVTGCVLAHSPVYREQVQYILYTSQQCHNMYDVAAVCVAFFGFILFCTFMKMLTKFN